MRIPDEVCNVMSPLNLFVPGAQKSASTTLFRILAQHPQIYASPKKEPHFFSRESIYEADSALYFQREFADRDVAQYCLDASQSYLEITPTPYRILKVLGNDVRFVIVLRHPVDRAESAFRHFRMKAGGK